METSLGRKRGCGGVVTACHCLVGLVVRLDGDDGVLSGWCGRMWILLLEGEGLVKKRNLLFVEL